MTPHPTEPGATIPDRTLDVGFVVPPFEALVRRRGVPSARENL